HHVITKTQTISIQMKTNRFLLYLSWLCVAFLSLGIEEVQAQQTGQLKGRVLDEDGNPLSGVSVSSNGHGDTKSTASDQSGVFVLNDLQVGKRYRITF